MQTVTNGSKRILLILYTETNPVKTGKIKEEKELETSPSNDKSHQGTS